MFTYMLYFAFHSMRWEGYTMKNQVELTISSIKIQEFQHLLPLADGFRKGTIFKELVRAFHGHRGDQHEQK